MASNSQGSSSEGENENFTFSFKMFTSWDYLIGNSETADNKYVSITTSFKESIVDEQESNKEENIHLTRFLRVLANFLICCLCGSGYLIYFVVKQSQEFSKMKNVSWYERNEVEIVMSLLGMFCPPLFETIAALENYHPRTGLKWQLGRIFSLFLGNLYTFLLALMDDVHLKLSKEEMIKNITHWTLFNYYNSSGWNESVPQPPLHPADVPRGSCWETAVGIPSYAEFDISGNVLGLIFNQGMICEKNRMYDVLHETIENDFPTFLGKIFAFLANPGLIIPAILLMLLAIYYLNSVSKSLSRANAQLQKKIQVLQEVEKNHKSDKERATATNSGATPKSSSQNASRLQFTKEEPISHSPSQIQTLDKNS